MQQPMRASEQTSRLDRLGWHLMVKLSCMQVLMSMLSSIAYMAQRTTGLDVINSLYLPFMRTHHVAQRLQLQRKLQQHLLHELS